MNLTSKTVFISYRRNVSSFIARAIFTELRSRGYDVFMDVESIDSGSFSSIIMSQIEARAHFLVILSPGTVERFSEPKDWMRREIEEAMRLKRNIIPVFVNGFQFDAASDDYLTGKLKKLKGYNGINLLHDYFEAGIDKLTQRFMNDPLKGAIKPLSGTEDASAQQKLEEITAWEKPTRSELQAEEYFNHAFQEYKERNYEAAVREYDRAIAINPRNSAAYHARGRVYYFLQKYQEAIEDFDRAIELDSGDVRAYIHRSEAFLKSRQYSQAFKDAFQAFKVDPALFFYLIRKKSPSPPHQQIGV